MIDIRLDDGTGLAALIFSGIQSSPEVKDAAAALIDGVKGRDAIILLCDWSNVAGWACEPGSLPVYEWVAAARRVERAAIVHHHRWKRQAAWLAALIRYGNGDVLSWRPDEAGAARRWLVAAREPSVTP